MEAERYEHFTICIESIAKNLKQLKTIVSTDAGVKGVHIFWLYILLSYPEGLTSAEIANRCGVDPSLISREIADLVKNNVLVPSSPVSGSRRKYNLRYTLTEEGRRIATKIQNLALYTQNSLDEGIHAEDLAVFYAVLDKLAERFMTMPDIIQNLLKGESDT